MVTGYKTSKNKFGRQMTNETNKKIAWISGINLQRRFADHCEAG